MYMKLHGTQTKHYQLFDLGSVLDVYEITWYSNVRFSRLYMIVVLDVYEILYVLGGLI